MCWASPTTNTATQSVTRWFVHYPRIAPRFKEDIIQTFYEGIRHKPETTFGNVKADVLADKDPHCVRGNFCSVVRGSAWVG